MRDGRATLPGQPTTRHGHTRWPKGAEGRAGSRGVAAAPEPEAVKTNEREKTKIEGAKEAERADAGSQRSRWRKSVTVRVVDAVDVESGENRCRLWEDMFMTMDVTEEGVRFPSTR
jgi:hypothetical protein